MSNLELTILAVDDQPDNLISLQAVVSDALPESRVLTALSGARAIELALSENPDVVLLDIVMPGMDGFEVCRRLKADERTGLIPVIVLTALQSTREQRLRALDAGAEGFLSKPIDELELVTQIRAMAQVKAAASIHLDAQSRLEALVAERTAALEQSKRSMLNALEDLRTENGARRAAQAELARTSELLERTAEVARVGGWNVDLNTLAMTWTPQTFAIVGMQAPVAPSLHRCAELLTPESLQMVLASVKTAIEHGLPCELELPLTTADGRTLWVQALGRVQYRDGQPVSLYGTLQDVTERALAAEALAESRQEYADVIAAIDQHAIVSTADLDGNILTVNDLFCAVSQYSREELIGQNHRMLGSGYHSKAFFRELWQTITSGNCWRGEVCNRAKDGSLYWVDTTIVPVVDSASGKPRYYRMMRNVITERKQAQASSALQAEVLELIAQGAPKTQTLNLLLSRIEEWSPDMRCSVLTLDADGEHLRSCAAPSLPPAYLRAIDGMAIGPNMGSCGTAVYRREPVVVADIATDPLWSQAQALALEHGLRACWATPIMGENGKVLGSFAIYYGTPRLPTQEQQQWIAMATHLAAICLGKQRKDEALRVSDLALRAISQGVVICGPDLRVMAINEAFTHITGYAEAELKGRDLGFLQGALTDPQCIESLQRNCARGSEYAGELLHYRKDGSEFWNELTISPVRNEAGHLSHFIGVARDISVRKAQSHKIARLNRIRDLLNGVSSAMLRSRDRLSLLAEACYVAVTDGGFPVAWVSEWDRDRDEMRIVAIHGAEPDLMHRLQSALEQVPRALRPAYRVRVSGRHLVLNAHDQEPRLAALIDELQLSECGSSGAFPLVVNGQVVAVLALMASERMYFDEEEVALLDWLAADLSFALEGLETSGRLQHLAFYDELTGVANARLFQDRLDQFIHGARSAEGQVCVAVVDLEGFTQINEAHGREVGDDVLRQVSRRFNTFLAEPFALGRIGSDTFAAASPRAGEIAAIQLRDQLQAALREPLQIGDLEVALTAQMGIALFPRDGDSGALVFRHAESVLKLAKSSGLPFVYFSGELNARIAQRRALLEELRLAVTRQQFVVHYQARIDMISGESVGAEALIRWQHPTKGLVAPGEFIGIAEDSGLIVAIGAWVLDSVCAQQSAWLAAGISVAPVAVNLSSVQFAKGDLLETVRTALATHSLDARYLEVELTESAVMADPASAARTLKALRVLGVGLALDDFGTGYSSLAHLKRFPFNSVKIDRSFVADITNNAEDAAIATAIIAMSHSLGLKVVAEGVETQGQFNYLRGKGCDEMQGHFFGAAVAASEFESQLRARKALAMPLASPSNQQTLLLVDDEQGVRAALVRMLRPDGYRILCAANAQEGLDLLAINRVQVIISDQRMPGMSGTDFLSTVKKLYPDTVRIILSGYTELSAVTDAVNRGAVFKFLTKPWDDELLREQVRDAFRRYRPTGA